MAVCCKEHFATNYEAARLARIGEGDFVGASGVLDDRQIVTVDVVLLTLREGRLAAGFVRRVNPPFADRLALIGGYVHADEDETADATAERVLREKTGLQGFFLEQLATFSGRERDPRGWSVSVAYLALTPFSRLAAPLAADERLVLQPVDEIPDMPFDHGRILQAALARLRGKGAYSTLPARLIDEPFSLSELQRVYEVALGGERLDKSSFRRKLNEMDLVEEVSGRRTDTGGRQAQLYRLRPGALVFDRHI
jgi:ADP-ribose pyrophosphatase YjhB (NUDIX family)